MGSYIAGPGDMLERQSPARVPSAGDDEQIVVIMRRQSNRFPDLALRKVRPQLSLQRPARPCAVCVQLRGPWSPRAQFRE